MSEYSINEQKLISQRENRKDYINASNQNQDNRINDRINESEKKSILKKIKIKDQKKIISDISNLKIKLKKITD